MTTRINWTRADFTPKGAIKIVAKDSSAVVFVVLATATRKAHAVGFAGKAQKPAFNFTFKTNAAAERQVAAFFASRRDDEQRAAARRAEKTAPHTLQIGHVLVASWGYDQTNVDFYQVTRIVGARTVELRAIASNVTETTSADSGRCIPSIDAFRGEPLVRRAGSDGRVKIDDVRRARIWEGRPVHWSSGH